jgi:hypothetical protein
VTLGLTLARVVDHLAGVLPGSPVVGTAQPQSQSELPALVLYASDAVEVRAGIGNVPRPPQRRPLHVTSEISLADPRLRFDGEVVELLAEDGRVLRLPHGALVHADGAPPPPPLGPADVTIAIDGTAYTLVTGAPGEQEFRFDSDAAAALGYGVPEAAGVLRFAAPITGETLRASYYVGEWELATSRYRGQLLVDVIADSVGTVTALSDAAAGALRPGTPVGLGTVYVLTPIAWGPIGLPESALGNARRRTLTFRFDIEIETPIIPAGGGVIARVDVESTIPPVPPSAVERFSVVSQESP